MHRAAPAVDKKEVIGEEGSFYLQNKIKPCSGDDELHHALLALSQGLTRNRGVRE